MTTRGHLGDDGKVGEQPAGAAEVLVERREGLPVCARQEAVPQTNRLLQLGPAQRGRQRCFGNAPFDCHGAVRVLAPETVIRLGKAHKHITQCSFLIVR